MRWPRTAYSLTSCRVLTETAALAKIMCLLFNSAIIQCGPKNGTIREVTDVELPRHLVAECKEGRLVLFLGAGASIGAVQPSGGKMVLAPELRDLIASRFLGTRGSTESLAWIAELAQSASDLFTVQDFIAEQFAQLEPAQFHNLIPTFRWRGIATTNFDRLVERVYSDCSAPIQELVPFLSDADRVDQKIRDPRSVALLKLHGCITRTHDEQLPLILTIEQYTTHRDNRRRLFRMFEEWASENSVIFVGHQLFDTDVRQMLLQLSRELPSRPRYYLVRPGLSDEEAGFWEKRGISPIDCTFEEFLSALDSEIDRKRRQILVHAPTGHPIVHRFKTTREPSEALLRFLAAEVEYVHGGLQIETGTPEKFYKGFGLGWYPIARDLDVKRRLAEEVIVDAILTPESDRNSEVELYVIKAEAGAGKSVLLRRIAWDAAIQANTICLFGRSLDLGDYGALGELCDSVGERVFLFVDNAADRVGEIRRILDHARGRGIKLTMITAERRNEWNVSCESLEEYLTGEYPLRYLNEAEIGQLVDLLEKYDALGPNLARKNRAERIREFHDRAGRQLLVALHEATLGKPFEDILLDEYQQLVPQEAKQLYLTVCALNRLNVPVRAGLISRVHGIPFEEFKRRLFAPLEHVVLVTEMPWGDFGYRARHSEIAQIVFEAVLTDSTDRFDEYIRVLGALNPMFSVDREALRSMTRAANVLQLFPEVEDGIAVYDRAEELLGEDAYLLQQRANFERRRADGDLKHAESLLQRAKTLAPRDTSIVHTMAEVYRKMASTAEQRLEREKYRAEAFALLESLDNDPSSARYAAVTRVGLGIDSVKDLLLRDEVIPSRQLDHSIRNVERALERARQRFPGDAYILEAEARFAELLEDDERSLAALQHAREENPRDPFIVARLSRILRKKGEVDKARKYVKEALDSNSRDKDLNFLYAELLRISGDADPEELIYYYGRSFSGGDDSYESRFWFARFAFESRDGQVRGRARTTFEELRRVPIAYRERMRIRDKLGGQEKPRKFSGSILRLEATHGFVTVDGSGEQIFFHRNNLRDDEAWSNLKSGDRVRLQIGFNLTGAVGLDVRSE